MLIFRNWRLNSDRLWLWGFFLTAIFLYTYNLGAVPFRDWDEGIVANIAREIWRAVPDSYTWLFPKNLDGTPYWNKPPLIHGLIALSYSCFGISEWSTRLPTATISALAVPLFFCISREIFQTRLEAIYATTVYLTLIPVVRHGRLAMLDGAITCFFAFVIWCLLREGRGQRAALTLKGTPSDKDTAPHKGRRQEADLNDIAAPVGRAAPAGRASQAQAHKSRGQEKKGKLYLLGAGLGLGLICLTKGVALGVLLGAIAFIFYSLIQKKYKKLNFSFVILILLGLIPAIAWYVLQIIHYGKDFIEINLGIQTFNRVITTVENNSSPPWYYLLELAKYTIPWLIFLPGGIKIALRQRQQIWAKLALVWFTIYLIAISLMATKLPWYITPIYPAFALLVGANLAQIHHKLRIGLASKTLLIIVAIIAWLGTIYYGWLAPDQDRDLFLVLGTLAFFLTIANILIKLANYYFIATIAIALYLALFLLFNSPHWNWELGESYAVKPVAQMIRRVTPAKQIIYTSYPYYRPSLDFYSDRVVIPLSNHQLLDNSSTEIKSTYLLLSKNDSVPSYGKDSQVLATTKEWQIVKMKPFSQEAAPLGSF